jgi:hypothetical protein
VQDFIYLEIIRVGSKTPRRDGEYGNQLKIIQEQSNWELRSHRSANKLATLGLKFDMAGAAFHHEPDAMLNKDNASLFTSRRWPIGFRRNSSVQSIVQNISFVFSVI